MRSAAFLIGLLVLTVFVGNASLAEERNHRAGQDLWRSCSSCHCVPDLRIPDDVAWLQMNETTTCIAGANDTPEARQALIAYLRAKDTFRPILVDASYRAPADIKTGTIRLPATAGSAYLKAERKSIRTGTPPKIRLHWPASENGTTLTVPIGDYRVVNYSFYRTDAQNRRWTAAGTSAEGCTQIVIGDKEVVFDLLPEIGANLNCKSDGDDHVLGFFMTNRNGKRMSLARDAQLMNPRWVIKGADGKQVDRGIFEVT